MTSRFAKPLRLVPALLPALALALAAPARAATLAEALHRWTGLNLQVTGAPPQVTITLPHASPVPRLTAHATEADRNGDRGWQITELAVPQPTRLRGGDELTIGQQQGQGWLGARTVQAEAQGSRIEIDHRGDVTRVDHATFSMNGTGGPVALAAELDGVHLGDATPDNSPLAPRHVVLRGHTTAEGAGALRALLDGRNAGAAPVTIDQATLALGPARFDGTGTVTLLGPDDREGELIVTAEHFSALIAALPQDGPAARLLPLFVILKQFGRKEAGHLTWKIAFQGRRVLVDGIDIGPFVSL